VDSLRCRQGKDLKAWIQKGHQIYLALGKYRENVHGKKISDIMQSLEVILKYLKNVLTATEREETTPTLTEEGECGVCMDRRATEVLLPCKHICVCSICVKKLNTCPICRTEIDGSCNRYIYATRTSGSTEKIFDSSNLSAGQQEMLTGLLLKLHEMSLI
jgi:hypothetical protein